jgi:hypothetical protein
MRQQARIGRAILLVVNQNVQRRGFPFGNGCEDIADCAMVRGF